MEFSPLNYNMLKIQDRLSFCQAIYKKQNVSYREINALSSNINFIRKIRNNINHYEPLIPVLLKYQDEGKEEAIFKILDLLKDLYYSGNIHSINVVRRVKFQKLSKCDYNEYSTHSEPHRPALRATRSIM